ncbi:hypothetical protein Tsubulata_009591 [Turnera subulata]|uniref:DUF630 domain-containing protein n=1 Tax=Turnera subulata TaxID=218843 RepID=A0A9Q0GIQ5_9ROSI|nr:hypothetical protein Tsubulata_009591 [Turnera subulata]
MQVTERKQHMKEAVSSRNAFAAAHVAHAMSPKKHRRRSQRLSQQRIPTLPTPLLRPPSLSSSATLPLTTVDEAPFPPPPLTTVLSSPPPLQF